MAHSPTIGCQYRGVYRHRDKWRATVKLTWRGGGQVRRIMIHVARQQESPLDAAVKLAEWFLRWLGPDWGGIIRQHRRYLWRYAPWQARYSERWRGWVLAVWIDGRREEVTRADGELKVFDSWGAAREYLHPWLQSRCGRDGHLRMWRHRAPSKFPDETAQYR